MTLPAYSADIHPEQLVCKRFRVKESLGDTPLSEVFVAVDTEREDAPVTLKFLHPEYAYNDPERKRLEAEVLRSQRISDPGIAQALGLLEDPVLGWFFVSEFIDGRPLSQLIYDAAKPLSLREMVLILRDVANILGVAYSRRILHGDLKPTNIFVCESQKVRLADFGHRKEVDCTATLYGHGAEAMFPYYQAPDEYFGHRSDIYSLGIIAFEMIAHRRPFEGVRYGAVAINHATQPLPSFRKIETKIPSWFKRFILQCAAKNPKDRFASVYDIVALLDRYAQDLK